MKVVCESCQAKYQVPDARVAGKKLKIRCKRCGATVLIRGDLEGAGVPEDGATTVAPASNTGGFAAAGLEWHVSVEGQVSGPFTMPELLNWLATSAAGWDAYVWREGFAEWVEARSSDEIVTAAGGAPTNVIAATGTEDEHPTQMFQGAHGLGLVAREPAQNVRRSVAPSSAASGYGQGYGAPARASVAPSSPSVRASQPPRSQSGVQSSVGSIAPASASRSPSRAPSLPPRAAASSPSLPPRTASNPRLQSAAPGAQPDDSVLFSTQNLHQVAQSGSQPPGYSPASRPGYAAGDGSGLVDIRALAQLARQHQSIAPRPMSSGVIDDGNLSYGEESRAVLLNQSGAFNRLDSLAPITPLPRAGSRSNALPLAIFGGFALLAAAAFAAIVITRAPVASNAPAALPPSAAPQAPVIAAAAQPVVPVPAEPAVAKPTPEQVAVAADEPARPAAEEPVVAPEPTKVADATKSANKHHTHGGARTVAEEKKAQPAPEEKKSKDKEKAAPPSLDDVMLASNTAAKEEKPAEEKPAKVEKAEKPEKTEAKGSNDDDDLLGLGASPKAPAKDRSIDDLLDGAVVKKPKGGGAAAAPAAASAAPAADLPESPSRDQVLSAMHGIESAVRACAAADGVVGTALLELQVDGSTGRVSDSNATGVDNPTSGCIAKAGRAARFPHFSKPSFTVKYPYRFK